MSHNYMELKVWQKSIELVKAVYRAVRSFPKEETFNLSSQMRKAAVSIPSNIAEGSGRSTNKSFKQFLSIALGSCYELQTQLIISKDLEFVPKDEFEGINELLTEICRMINGLQKNLDVKSLES